MGIFDSFSDAIKSVEKTVKKAKKDFDKSTAGKAWKKYNEINERIDNYIDNYIDTTIDNVIGGVATGAKQVGKGAAKIGRVVSGYEAYDSRKKANKAKEQADAIVANVKEEDKRRKAECNRVLKAYGESKLHALKTCVRPFLNYIEILGNNYNDKTYFIQNNVHVDNVNIQALKQLDMNASQALGTAAVSSLAASIALAGVPSATTAAVGALATASTGTAISSLSGAAATNATLAWLGGGSLAAGGGGVAAGTVVLSTITYATTGVFALAAAGIVGAAYYSKKYTEATKYLEEVKKYRANAKLGWQVIDGINQRAMELESVTHKLEERMKDLLQYLEPLVYDFQSDDDYYAITFQNAALCAKSISDIAQIPLLDEKGNLNGNTNVVLSNTQEFLNRNL